MAGRLALQWKLLRYNLGFHSCNTITRGKIIQLLLLGKYEQNYLLHILSNQEIFCIKDTKKHAVSGNIILRSSEGVTKTFF